MPRGRPKQEMTVSPSEREQLLSMTRSRSLPHAPVRRAEIVLMSADGSNDIAIGKTLKVSRLTVGVWRRRFMAQRVTGLYDELRSGGPRVADVPATISTRSMSPTSARRTSSLVNSCRFFVTRGVR